MKNFIISRVKAVGLTLALILSVSLAALYMQGPRFLDTLENKSYDLRFNIRGEEDPGRTVVIVAIDDKSIKALGRFPWPRAYWPKLIRQLKNSGAKVIASDLLFNEKERGFTKEEADALMKSAPDEASRAFISASISGDKELAESISDFGKIVLPMILYVPMDAEQRQEKPPPDYLDAYAFSVEKGDAGVYKYLEADHCDAPLKELAEASSSVGHIYAYLDRDGTMRWEALSVGYDLSAYPSLGLCAAREYLDLPKEAMELEYGQGVKLGDRFIPTDEHGRMLINYYGPEQTFRYIPFIDALEGRYEEGAFKDKIVLIGATAQGIYDMRITPFSGNIPGVEKHATVIQNILSSSFMQKSSMGKPVTLALIIAIGIFFGIALPRTGAVNGMIIAFTLLAAHCVVCYVAMVKYGLWLDFVYPAIAIISVYLVITSYRFLAEELRAGSIKRIFSHYVTPKIVEELAKNPELAKLGGERKEITVMFSDIRGFTTFSESRQPEEVVARLNEYMSGMTQVIFDHDGTVDKFVGDEIMAFWGAPVPQEDQAERAVMCAAEMVKKLDRMREAWVAEGKSPLYMGIGINTGDMVVGNMGAEGMKMDYTVIGDNVNLGARVETLTRNYDANIIISEYTYKKIKDRQDKGESSIKGVEFIELDSVKVKGKERPVTIFKVDPIDEEAQKISLPDGG